MRPNSARRSFSRIACRRAATLTLALTLLLPLATPAPADPSILQPAGGAEPSAEPRFTVPLGRLLNNPRVLTDEYTGPVWTLTAGPGRRLIQLPLEPIPGTAAKEIGTPVYEIAGGRFIAWEIPGDDTTTTTTATLTADQPTDAELLDLDTLLQRGPELPLDTGSLGNLAEGIDAAVSAPDLPEGAPRLAREVTLTPGGTVIWTMDRAISGEVVEGTGPYLLKLRGERLRELQPEPLSRESRSDRDAAAAYRDAVGLYRDLQTQVRDLPERFEVPLPDTLWAIFETSTALGRISIRGPESGDWSISDADFELLRSLTTTLGGATADAALTPEASAAVSRLTALARDRHPWTQRLLSGALVDAGAPAKARPNDPLFVLLGTVLGSDDALARNRLVYALTRVEPMTPGAAGLLDVVAKNRGGTALQLAALRADLRLAMGGDASSGGAPGGGGGGDVNRAVQIANAALRRPDGPNPAAVIEELLLATADTPDNHAALIGGVRFDGIPPDRQDAAIAGALRAAEISPEVAAGWVDVQLLGSNDVGTTDRTLRALARAESPSVALRPLTRALNALIFRGPDPAGDAAPTQNPATPAPPKPRPDDLVLYAGIPLDRANHSLFRVLNSGDPAKRDLGWRVLRHFELPNASTTPTATPAEGETPDPDPLALILDAGLGQTPTPPSLVPFLERQPDETAATDGLVRVVLRGDPAASRRAARVLRGSGRDLAAPLAALPPDERLTFVNRVYDHLGDGPEPVAGLIREGEAAATASATITWFTGELAAGTLPDAAAWAAQYPTEEALITLVQSDDEALAKGAIAALAASAGADREAQYRVIDRLREGGQKPTVEMTDAWLQEKQRLYTERLAEAAGEYRLVMQVDRPDAAAGAPAPDAAGDAAVPEELLDTRFVLGNTTLIADGRTVQLEGRVVTLSVSDEELALRIDNVGQLKDYPRQELQALPLERVEEPLVLRPGDDGTWRGEVPLPAGQTFRLAMEPISP